MGVLQFKSVSGGEKNNSRTCDSQDERGLAVHQDWTPEEEKLAKRKLDLIIMPLLTLGFFCLRESPAVTCATQALTSGRTRSRKHGQCNYRRLHGGYWDLPEPIQRWATDAFPRHCPLRDPEQHDPVPCRPRQMAYAAALPVRHCQLLPGFPNQLRVIHCDTASSWYHRVWIHSWWPLDVEHLVHTPRDSKAGHV